MSNITNTEFTMLYEEHLFKLCESWYDPNNPESILIQSADVLYGLKNTDEWNFQSLVSDFLDLIIEVQDFFEAVNSIPADDIESINHIKSNAEVLIYKIKNSRVVAETYQNPYVKKREQRFPGRPLTKYLHDQNLEHVLASIIATTFFYNAKLRYLIKSISTEQSQII